MYKHLLILVFIITTCNTYGQNYSIGVIAGYKNSNVKSENFGNTKSRKGIELGLSLEKNLGKKIFSEVGLLYSQKGFVLEGPFTDLTGQPTGLISITHLNYNYISLPLKIGFNYGNKISGFINIGLAPSLLLNSNHTTEAIEGIVEEVSGSTTESVSKFDIGGLIELGGKYKLSNWCFLFSSVELESSFISISNEEYFREESIKHYGINIKVGLKYALLNKTGSNMR
jgi:hypothetical protein